MTAEQASKLARLRAILDDVGSALVTFSGGADSALVLKIAIDQLGPRAEAMTAVSPTMPRRERAAAQAFAAAHGIVHHVLDSHELERPGFAANPVDRCYLCKAELLELARPLAAQRGLSHVLLGTNVDDLGEHRPGLAAADERGARHPLVEAGLTKADVRAVSRALGLSTWDKPQLACLSSRFPYGTAIDADRLGRLDLFEEGLVALGFRQVRVRFHDQVARLEVEAGALAHAIEHREAIVALGKRCGFHYVALDLQGFRSGAMNEALVALRRPR